MNELRFAWWNLQDFAHFDSNRVSEQRWPASADEYAAKCRAVDAAFDRLFGAVQPEVIGLCEVTETAARELQARRFPGHSLLLPPAAGNEFHIAVLVARINNLRPLTPVAAEQVPSTTRPMPVIQLTTADDRIRFVFCHWTAFGENGELYRSRTADTLREYVYQFLRLGGAKSTPHVVLVGDLNVEPFDPLFAGHLHAHRDRATSRGRRHSSDADVSRVRLYNCGWRLLGEHHPHGPTVGPVTHSAGTHFGADGWKTYDQVLVSGGLLSTTPPYLDESELRVAADSELLDAEGRPAKFEYQNGQPQGLSDHLPLVGRIVLA